MYKIDIKKRVFIAVIAVVMIGAGSIFYACQKDANEVQNTAKVSQKVPLIWGWYGWLDGKYIFLGNYNAATVPDGFIIDIIIWDNKDINPNYDVKGYKCSKCGRDLIYVASLAQNPPYICPVCHYNPFD